MTDRHSFVPEQTGNNNAPNGHKPSRTDRIRQLNDQLRRTGDGGIVTVTRGIAALGPDQLTKIVAAISVFDAFTPDNDPYGEHDGGVLEVDGVEVYWKIDYYDRSLRIDSPDAADPQVTSRVLTIMRLDEY